MEDKLQCNIGLYEEGEASGGVWCPDLHSENGIMPLWTWQLDHGGATINQPALIDPIPDLLESYSSVPLFPQLDDLFQDDIWSRFDDDEVAWFCEGLKVDQKEEINNNVKEISIAAADSMSADVGKRTKSGEQIMIKRETMTKSDCNYGQIEGGDQQVSMIMRRKEGHQTTSRVNNLTFEEVSRYFYMPITQAAKELNIGLTLLKKKCRELGIHRWPHRKMKSLQTLIENVQVLGRPEEGESGEAQLRSAIEILEQERKMMEKEPSMQLEEKTKRLRQACFKANYKKRRLMAFSGLPPPPSSQLPPQS